MKPPFEHPPGIETEAARLNAEMLVKSTVRRLQGESDIELTPAEQAALLSTYLEADDDPALRAALEAMPEMGELVAQVSESAPLVDYAATESGDPLPQDLEKKPTSTEALSVPETIRLELLEQNHSEMVAREVVARLDYIAEAGRELTDSQFARLGRITAARRALRELSNQLQVLTVPLKVRTLRDGKAVWVKYQETEPYTGLMAKLAKVEQLAELHPQEPDAKSVDRLVAQGDYTKDEVKQLSPDVRAEKALLSDTDVLTNLDSLDIRGGQADEDTIEAIRSVDMTRLDALREALELAAIGIDNLSGDIAFKRHLHARRQGLLQKGAEAMRQAFTGDPHEKALQYLVTIAGELKVHAMLAQIHLEEARNTVQEVELKVAGTEPDEPVFTLTPQEVQRRTAEDSVLREKMFKEWQRQEGATCLALLRSLSTKLTPARLEQIPELDTAIAHTATNVLEQTLQAMARDEAEITLAEQIGVPIPQFGSDLSANARLELRRLTSEAFARRQKELGRAMDHPLITSGALKIFQQALREGPRLTAHALPENKQNAILAAVLTAAKLKQLEGTTHGDSARMVTFHTGPDAQVAQLLVQLVENAIILPEQIDGQAVDLTVIKQLPTQTLSAVYTIELIKQQVREIIVQSSSQLSAEQLADEVVGKAEAIDVEVQEIDEQALAQLTKDKKVQEKAGNVVVTLRGLSYYPGRTTAPIDVSRISVT
ncbi:hypothetical protein KKB83_02960 [Patescibacteria group bacterium]|nr:hypothetical protein [Patescibacteria group bacterium]